MKLNSNIFPEETVKDPGVSKLEIFSCLILQGMMANGWKAGDEQKYAEASVKFAEALLSILEKQILPK